MLTTLYPIALFVHIVGAIAYFVVFGVVYASVVGIRQARNVQALRLWASATKVAERLHPISSLCILVAGLYMVIVSWGWQADWAFVGLGAYVLLGFASGTLQGQRIVGIERQVKDMPVDAPLPAAIVARAQDPVLWVATNAMVATAIGIVFLMTVKPGVLGALVALLVALAAGLAIGLLTQRRFVATPAAVAAVADVPAL